MLSKNCYSYPVKMNSLYHCFYSLHLQFAGPAQSKKVATANCHRPVPDVFGGVELRRRVGASAGTDRLRRGAVVHLAVHLALDFDFGSATVSLLFTSHFDPRCSPRTAHTKLQLSECGRQTTEPPGERVYRGVRVCVLPRAGRVVYLAMLRSTAVVAGAKARALSRPDRHQVRVSLRIMVECFTRSQH